MQKGFTLIEIMMVLGIVIIAAMVVLTSLGQFARQRNLETSTRSLVALLRDAQNRAIGQEDGRYWGVRVENLDVNDRYFLFNATSAIPITVNTSTTSFLKGSAEFLEPSLNTNTTIIFDKISGSLIQASCPSPGVSSTIQIGLVSDPSNSSTIKIYCNGLIEP